MGMGTLGCKFNGVEKYEISFNEILDEEGEETVGEFFVFIFLDVFFYVVVTTHN
jgi:hypothetical protein